MGVSTVERLFRVEGETFDLENLVELFHTGTRRVIVHDGTHYLSLQMPAELDDEGALIVAEDELAIMTGLAFLLVRNHHPVRIAGVSTLDRVTGKIRTTVYGKGTASARGRLRGKGIVINSDGTVDEPPTPRESPGDVILELATGNEPLQRALFLYGRLSHDWRSLYMILEAIEDGNGGERGLVQKPWASEQAKNFKTTANSYKALGTEARHGTTSKGVESPRLTLPEARKFIREILNSWIEDLSRK